MRETYESVIGHHYTVKVKPLESELLNHFRDEYDINTRLYVHITEYDVDWDEPRGMKMPLKTFMAIAADIQECQAIESIAEDMENRDYEDIDPEDYTK